MRSNSRTFLSTLLFLTLIRGLNTEIFTSTALLSEAITVEREIVGQLLTYIEDSVDKISRLRSLVNEFNRVQEPIDVDEVSSNPLSAFQIIKQLAIHWKKMDKFLNESLWQDLTQQIQSQRINSLIPKREDVEGAALGILRLQETYKLNASDLVRGNIFGIRSSIELTTGDCVYLGKNGFNQELFELAIDWYGQALCKSKNETNHVVAPQKIMKYLDEAIKKHNTGMQNEEYRKFSEFLNPIHSACTKYKLGLGISKKDQFINYNALCRGEQLRSDSEVASLNCYLSDRGDASFYINPIKVEVHSHDPQILTFHDIIYESEIDFIKEFSKPSLERSTVSPDPNYPDNKGISNERTSQNTWLFDDEKDEQLRRKVKLIMDRVSKITGLNVHGDNNSEEMQVANYGIGGHYGHHHDYYYEMDLPPEEIARRKSNDYQILGDRISTLMFYLSDVKLGGATVFPLVGAAVWPSKGSAVFWYNLHKNCQADPRSLHGGCPVLHGSKWIANKFIREVNQVFKRPCSLNRKE